MSINNKIMDALGGQGYTGSINERIQANLLDLYGEANINVGLSKAGGFKSYVRGLIGGAEQWAAQLDGATKYWQLSEPIIIPANVNYEIGFYASRALNDTNLLYIFGYSLGNVDAQHRLALSSGVPQKAYGMGFVAKDFNFNGEGQFTLTHNGTSKVTFIDFNTSSDAFNDQTITIDRLMGPWLGADSGYLNGYVRDFYVKVGGVEILRIPLTNKEQGATQLATVGNINATMINYTGDEWERP